MPTPPYLYGVAYFNKLMSKNSSSGISVVSYLDAVDNGYKNDLLAIRNEFAESNILFGGITMLGSLEDESSYQTMRESGKEGFGIVPVPLYRERSATVSDEYNTLVHNLARIVAIASQTDKFEMCSAFLDYQSRNSAEILETYYEQNLAASVRGAVSEDNIKMLNYIRNHVRDCFDKTFEDVIGNYNSTDTQAAMRRWHEIIRSMNFQVTSMEIEYDRLYLQKKEDIQLTLAQWNALP